MNASMSYVPCRCGVVDTKYAWPHVCWKDGVQRLRSRGKFRRSVGLVLGMWVWAAMKERAVAWRVW